MVSQPIRLFHHLSKGALIVYVFPPSVFKQFKATSTEASLALSIDQLYRYKVCNVFHLSPSQEYAWVGCQETKCPLLMDVFAKLRLGLTDQL